AEALLCGAPVIATNSGGVTDIVIENETGLLFPERDAPALAVALENYARDSAYAARLAQNGRALVLERFTPERVAAQFLAAYENAIQS
ncbi:MAG: glycosyl transferase, partial [Chloroflexi bacterium]